MGMATVSEITEISYWEEGDREQWYHAVVQLEN